MHWMVQASRAVTYEVAIVEDVLCPEDPTLARAGAEPGSPARRYVVVDSAVAELHGSRIERYFAHQQVRIGVCVLDVSEEVKSVETALRILRALERFGIDRRREPILAIGGGVLCDIVGLVASLYRRSTPYVRVPTTLIGLVDAGVGVKTGVNFDGHKNRLGTYHPAACSLLDRSFLATLDRRHISNGLAEILKLALIKDRYLFDLLECHGARLRDEKLQAATTGGEDVARQVLARAVDGMLEELEPNLWEHQLERRVDYGHSFSPAIEMRALPELLHGEAVSIDMALTTMIGRSRGLVDGRDADRVLSVMRQLGLPVWHPVCEEGLLRAALAETVRHRGGAQRLPLPVGIGGACFVNDLSERELVAACAELRSLAGIG
jgi:3-dehydroquinate synthase